MYYKDGQDPVRAEITNKLLKVCGQGHGLHPNLQIAGKNETQGNYGFQYEVCNPWIKLSSFQLLKGLDSNTPFCPNVTPHPRTHSDFPLRERHIRRWVGKNCTTQQVSYLAILSVAGVMAPSTQICPHHVSMFFSMIKGAFHMWSRILRPKSVMQLACGPI